MNLNGKSQHEQTEPNVEKGNIEMKNLMLNMLAVTALATAIALPASAAEKPRLVLQITVDQFRGDLPTRYCRPARRGRAALPARKRVSTTTTPTMPMPTRKPSSAM